MLRCGHSNGINIHTPKKNKKQTSKKDKKKHLTVRAALPTSQARAHQLGPRLPFCLTTFSLALQYCLLLWSSATFYMVQGASLNYKVRNLNCRKRRCTEIIMFSLNNSPKQLVSERGKGKD